MFDTLKSDMQCEIILIIGPRDPILTARELIESHWSVLKASPHVRSVVPTAECGKSRFLQKTGCNWS
jgi:hypothetical protein